jgi:hypothetical protein
MAQIIFEFSFSPRDFEKWPHPRCPKVDTHSP